MNCVIFSCLTAVLLFVGSACQWSQPTSPASPTTHASATCDCCAADASPAAATRPAEIPTTGAHSIVLPVMEPELPAGPGRLTVLSACTQCHSPRYVTMQPAFPRKTWIAEVDKMKKVYGAPILDDQVEPIVNYLVAIRGKD